MVVNSYHILLQFTSAYIMRSVIIKAIFLIYNLVNKIMGQIESIAARLQPRSNL